MSLISFWIIFYTMQFLWEKSREKHFTIPSSLIIYPPRYFLGERKILVNTITLTFYGTTQNSPLKLLSGKSFKHWNYFLHTQFFHIYLFIFCIRIVKIKLEWMSDRRRLNENSPQRKRKRKYPFAHWNDPRIQINSTKTSPIIVNFHVVVCRQRKNMWKFYF